MKSKEFIRDYVMPAGGVLEKKDGDHYIFKLPNGRRLIVPIGGRHTEALPYLEAKLRRLLREP